MVKITLGPNGRGTYANTNYDTSRYSRGSRIFRTDYGHSEVAAHFGDGKRKYSHHQLLVAHYSHLDPREYSISTKDFVIDDEGKLKGLNTVRVEWTKDSGGRWKMEEVPGSEKFFPAQLVFLALGFLGPESDIIKALGVKQDARSNIQTPAKKFSTGVDGVFTAGDCHRGQSLIVWGIRYVYTFVVFLRSSHWFILAVRAAVLQLKSTHG